ncbi:MAG: hypothetical protein KTR16_11435 [Acidiferrobacterales bacterium]|nr:hypothetical protein [Acidiferrobacterales bacterium]
MRASTVVFQIEDEESFKDIRKQLNDKFGAKDGGWSVSAMSRGDEILRLEHIETLLSELNANDAAIEIQTLLGVANVADYDVDSVIAEYE